MGDRRADKEHGDGRARDHAHDDGGDRGHDDAHHRDGGGAHGDDRDHGGDRDHGHGDGCYDCGREGCDLSNGTGPYRTYRTENSPQR